MQPIAILGGILVLLGIVVGGLIMSVAGQNDNGDGVVMGLMIMAVIVFIGLAMMYVATRPHFVPCQG